MRVTLLGMVMLPLILPNATAITSPWFIKNKPSMLANFPVKDISDKQREKTPSPILVTLSGIVMLVRLEQPEKAPLPMLVTLSGIEILVRLEQP